MISKIAKIWQLKYKFSSSSQINVLINVPKTLQIREKFECPRAIIASFNDNINLFRVFDENELERILKTNKITGGVFSIPSERAHGASWTSNITDAINFGNNNRNNRLSNNIFLAILRNSIDKTFFHLDPKLQDDIDPNGPNEQLKQIDKSVIGIGLGASVQNVSLDEIELYSVSANNQISELSIDDAKQIVSKEKQDINLRSMGNALSGSIYGVDVSIRPYWDSKKKIYLWEGNLIVDSEFGGKDTERVVFNCKSKDEVIEKLKQYIEYNYEKLDKV